MDKKKGIIVTKPIEIKASGKIAGIKGLYKSTTTGRLYVRYSYHGYDKQRTIQPKNMTFSELKRCAEKALNEIKKEMQARIRVDECQTTTVKKDIVSFGIEQLNKIVVEQWTMRGVGYAHMHRILKTCEKLALCGSKRNCDIEKVNAHNYEIASKLILDTDIPPHTRQRHFENISNVFTLLITKGLHFGKNPAADFSKPKAVVSRRKCNLNFETAAKVYASIVDQCFKHEAKYAKELLLFFRLCVETGQRPLDVFFFDMRKIAGGHYTFTSHKTKREQRASHALSKGTLSLIGDIVTDRCGSVAYEQEIKNPLGKPEVFECFWSRISSFYLSTLNRFIKEVQYDATLYHTRHFFVTEIFNRTNSEFWAEVFTHDGHNTNQRHYLHVDQKKADEILLSFCADFQKEIDKLST